MILDKTQIDPIIAQATNYDDLIERLLDHPDMDNFWLKYGLSKRALSQQPIEPKLTATLFEKFRQAAEQSIYRRENLLLWAYGDIVEREPQLVDETLFLAIADAVTRHSSPSARKSLQTMLALTANMMCDVRYEHAHILSVSRKYFGPTYHSGLYLFQFFDGLRSMFDGDLAAPEDLATKWRKSIKKRGDSTDLCNGASYSEKIIPALSGLLEKAIVLNAASPSRFQGASQALERVGREHALIPV